MEDKPSELNHKGQTRREAYGDWMTEVKAFHQEKRRKQRACFWSWPWGHDYDKRGVCNRCRIGWPGHD